MAKYASYQDKLDSGMERIVLTAPDCMVQIAPQSGLNLYSWIVSGRELMMPTQNVGNGGAGYGNPILFPTPNRIRDCTYTFQGKQHTLTKNGKERFLHGLVMDEPFKARHWSDENGAYCEGIVSIEAGSDMASGYPFPCTLTTLISFCEKGIKMDFTVVNDGDGDMPFGVAIHPYFTKAGDDKQVFLRCPAEKRYEVDEKLLPSGVLIDVAGDERYDLSKMRSLADTDVDTVYLGMDASKTSRIEYRAWGKAISINADDAFARCVVYTPKTRPGFCIEPQTCATDFINMHAKGLEKEAGMMTLAGGACWKGSLSMGVESL